MAEDRQDLMPPQEQDPSETVLGMGAGQHRGSCMRKTLYSGISIFVALLIAGQAVTVYYVTQQQTQINKLSLISKQLQLESLQRKLPSGPSSQVKPMRMAMFSMPLALRADVDTQNKPKKINLTALENTAKKTNKMEDHVKYMIAKENPHKPLPDFNKSLTENLEELKKGMSSRDWKEFEIWAHKWLLFNLVQKSNETETRLNSIQTDPVTEAPVMSKCQLEASQTSSKHQQPGSFSPQCAENGDYLSVQCWRSTGYCWCVYKNGTEIPETRTRGKLDCSSIQDPEGSSLETGEDAAEDYGPVSFN
ncbi:HLA class II histocompatibility antigen gamma chain [Rhinatrema bivittatum]|uniref:HLA class II histocompatibility antigen gamma chain n=1 Tax=Rhinatrema bivittatum TaxID=194408 RepID=UPI001126A8FE|nr:HLA class II histocompatibility antigen gamma chain [Rhinatrema bivittatum]